MKFHFSPACILLSILIVTLAGCSNNYVDKIDRGAGYQYQPGFPELRLAATGQITENNVSTVIVNGDIVYGSLVYEQENDTLQARILIEIAVQRKTDEQMVVEDQISFSETIRAEDQNIINSQDVFRFEKVFDVPPGSYTIRTVVTDQVSGKQTSRTQETSIPDPTENVSHITDIRILTKNTNSSVSDFNQATTYDIQSSNDSLKFTFQVTNNNPNKPLNIESRLIRFRSDTSIARPMNYNDYSASNIAYIGIDYDEFEVIQSSTRTLTQPGSVVIEFIFEDLQRGNYRLEVTSKLGEEDELYKARDFSIKSPNYPTLQTAKEFARPLYYLMSESEYEKLMAIENAQELKKAIDRFWLSNVQNSNKAKNVISLYYERVEEANKMFSNFKEGWKTDPGMIYILFGPPWYNEQFSGQMLWSYSYNRNDPEKNFLFNQTRLNSKFFPFNNFLLERTAQYYNIQSQQVNRWLSGSILNYNL
ncbi:GWxTD domain-containing protein [Gracilimonas sp.]|uniref:GWxTD domain-containing protein n=1 Tax=Gracilimonas sp. TaxID=1974203 RepID=UPI0032EDF5ED